MTPSTDNTKLKEEIVNEFITQQQNASRMGSGDDQFYAKQISDYVNKQKRFWIDFVGFVENKAREGYKPCFCNPEKDLHCEHCAGKLMDFSDKLLKGYISKEEYEKEKETSRLAISKLHEDLKKAEAEIMQKVKNAMSELEKEYNLPTMYKHLKQRLKL